MFRYGDRQEMCPSDSLSTLSLSFQLLVQLTNSHPLLGGGATEVPATQKTLFLSIPPISPLDLSYYLKLFLKMFQLLLLSPSCRIFINSDLNLLISLLDLHFHRPSHFCVSSLSILNFL